MRCGGLSTIVLFGAIAVGMGLLAAPTCGADEASGPGDESAVAGSPRLSAALERLDAAQKRYYEQMRAVMPYYDDKGNPLKLENEDKDWGTVVTERQWEEVPRLDTVLKECLLVAFDELRDVARVRRALERSAVLRQVRRGTFDMRSNPQAPPLPGVDMPFSTHLSESQELPEVLCWSFDSRGGAKIFVLQNSLLRPMAGWARGLVNPYIITVFPRESCSSTITSCCEQDTVSFECVYPPSFFTYFLDAVNVESDYPDLVFIDYASAGQTDLAICRLDFDPKTHTWRETVGLALGRGWASGVHYEPESRQLRYEVWREELGDSEPMLFDIREWEHIQAPAQ